MRRKLLFALVAVCAASAPGSALADAGCARRAVDFTAAVELEVGLEPRAIVAADFNHDGIPDLASADSEDDTISVLIGLGRGMFQPRRPLAAGGSPYDVDVADFNKDGHTDLVAANRSADYISILLGGGNGTFASQRRVKTGGLSPRQVIPRDFDGDGNIDLAAADSLGVSFLRGKGDGTFLAPRNYPVTGYLWCMAAADLNGDALPDLALVDDSPDRIPIFLAEAGGSFVAGSIPVGPEPASVVAGDLDGDGDSDLAVSRDGGDLIEVLLGAGDGTFVKAAEFSVASDDLYDTGVVRAAADVDADGDLDLLTADFSGNGVTIIPGNGDGSFGPHTRWSSGGQVSDVAVADLDGYGRPDIATTNASMNTLWLLFGRGEGRFRTAQRKFHPLDPIDLAAGDFDGDGHPDLATVDLKRDAGQVFLGRGDGTIQSRRDGGFFTGPSQKAIAAGDFDEDGRWEIASAGGTADQGNLWVRELTDQGYSLALELPAASLAADVAAADADGDRHLDLVTANPEIDSLSFYRGRGDGTFDPPAILPAGDGPGSVVVADLNADGSPDLAAANRLSGDVSVLLGRGGGAFSAAAAFPAGSLPLDLKVGDVNGDAKLDLVISHESITKFSVLLGAGDGTFASLAGTGAGTPSASIVLSDLNADGLLDVAAPHQLKGTALDSISVHLGIGGGAFAAAETFVVSYATTVAIATADCDGDVLPDLATCNFDDAVYSGDVAVLLNLTGKLDGPDCNGNGLEDACDISEGTSRDANANGIPDECEAGAQLAGDCSQDGSLDMADVLCILGGLFSGNPARFPCGDGTAIHPGNVALLDAQGDGRLNIADPVFLLRALFQGEAPQAWPGGKAGECAGIAECPEDPGCPQ